MLPASEGLGADRAWEISSGWLSRVAILGVGWGDASDGRGLSGVSCVSLLECSGGFPGCDLEATGCWLMWWLWLVEGCCLAESRRKLGRC